MAPQANDTLDPSVDPRVESEGDLKDPIVTATVYPGKIYEQDASYCMEAQVTVKKSKEKHVSFQSLDEHYQDVDLQNSPFFESSYEKEGKKRRCFCFQLDWFFYTVLTMTLIVLVLIGFGVGSGLFLPRGNESTPLGSVSIEDQTGIYETDKASLVDSVQGRQDYKYSVVTLLGLPMIMERSSPQAQALEWLAYKDVPLFDASESERTPEEQDRHAAALKQRYALTVWYFDQGGPTVWKTLNRDEAAGWMTFGAGVHECDWMGVDCDYNAGDTTKGTVVGLRLSPAIGVVLTGTSISSELGLLTSLRRIDFSGQRLQGSIPYEWSFMTNLETLILSGNQLATTIPEWIGSNRQSGRGWDKLEVLALDGNSLYGNLPSSLENLRSLKHLELQLNPRLEGNFEEIIFSQEEDGTLKGPGMNLEHLDLSSTSLEGKLPRAILPSMRVLRLWYLSGIQGTIPTQVGKWSNLEIFSLKELPRLRGSLPAEFGLLSRLKKLEVFDNNSMSGELPTEIGNLSSNLEIINFGYTNQTGNLPIEWSNLVNLEKLILTLNNNLSGTIPTEYAQMTSLRYLDLRETNLSGEISEENMCSIDNIEVYTDCPRDGSNGKINCLCCKHCGSS